MPTAITPTQQPLQSPLASAQRSNSQSQGTAAPTYQVRVRPVSRVIRPQPRPVPQANSDFPYHWFALVTVAGLLGMGYLLGGGLVMLGVLMGWITLGMLFLVRNDLLGDLRRLLG